MSGISGGRQHAPSIDALQVASDAAPTLRAPGPGWFVARVRSGEVVTGGQVIGELELLGRRTLVLAPASAHGVVLPGVRGGRVAVAYKDALCALDPSVGAGTTPAHAATASGPTADGLVFRAPSSGRFYGRPGPGKPAFVEVGATVTSGQTVCMLEVMKTFHRVNYGGAGLPAAARVAAVLVADEADVNAGDALLRLEPVG